MKLLTMHIHKVDPQSVGHDSLETGGKLKSDSVIWDDYTVLFNSYQLFTDQLYTYLYRTLFL